MKQATAAAIPIRERAAKIAAKCEDAYSFDRYRSWVQVAVELVQLGFSDQDVETIMRSKYTRWAADTCSRYDRIPARAVREFVLKNLGNLPRDLGVKAP